MLWNTLTLAILLGLAAGCIDPNEPGTLVPPTVTEDPSLPRRTLHVAGASRAVHVREFGDPAKPKLFILPGSVSDIRSYQRLSALADAFHVIMWDMRGNGLSERVSAEELDLSDMAEEIDAMRREVSPHARVNVLGHSWSATFVALYLARHPDAVDRAVLIEPPGLKSAWQARVGLALSLLSPGYLDLVWSDDFISPVDHETLDFKALMMLKSGVRNFYCDPDDPPHLPVWRPGGLALLHWEAAILDGASLSYDFTPGLADFPGRVLLVGSACSPIGTDFQKATNATAFAHPEILHIPDSGHRIQVEQPEALNAGVRAFLEAP